MNLWRRLEARKNLYHLRDQRAFAPFLGQTLFEAARTWPSVLPWKWKPRTVLDVGAYRGHVARQLSELYHPEFIGLVEPQPNMAARLESMTLAPRQKVFACALGRGRGKAVLNVLANAPSSTLLQPASDLGSVYHRDMHIVDTVTVEVRTLDDVFSECKLDDLDLLKVDVEGYELEVFAGGPHTL